MWMRNMPDNMTSIPQREDHEPFWLWSSAIPQFCDPGTSLPVDRFLSEVRMDTTPKANEGVTECGTLFTRNRFHWVTVVFGDRAPCTNCILLISEITSQPTESVIQEHEILSALIKGGIDPDNIVWTIRIVVSGDWHMLRVLQNPSWH